MHYSGNTETVHFKNNLIRTKRPKNLSWKDKTLMGCIANIIPEWANGENILKALADLLLHDFDRH